MNNLTKSNLEIKTVQFNGVNLIGIKTLDGNVYTVIKTICEDLGLNTRGQVQRIQRDEILSLGACILHLPSPGGIQETFCLNVNKLPFWLTGISSNKCKPEIREQLLEFKLKADKKLSELFVNYEGMKQETIKNLLPTNYIQALEALLESEKQKQQLLLESEETNKKLALIAPKAEAFDGFMSAINSLTFSATAKSYGIGRNKLFEFCREKKLLMSNNQPYQKYLDLDYFEVKTINVQRSDNSFNTTQTFVTAKGQEYIYKLLQKDKQVSFLKKVG